MSFTSYSGSKNAEALVNIFLKFYCKLISPEITNKHVLPIQTTMTSKAEKSRFIVTLER